MDMILHAALFKGYWIPPTFGEKPRYAPLRTERRKPVKDLRKRIIDAMIALGGQRLSIAQIRDQIDLADSLTSQNVRHYLHAMQKESLVKRNRNTKPPRLGGQVPSLWSLVL
jgi:hypothetical protein